MLNSYEIISQLSPVSKSKIEYVGDILQYLIPWSGLMAIALEGNIGAAQNWLFWGVTNALLTLLLKYLFNFTPLGRRPNGGPYAFPSGHTSSAFMGAAFFHFYFGLSWAFGPYLLAAFTGYSRIHANKHHLRDVLAGAALATGIVFIF